MASALLVDYVLTVAVSVSAGVANLGSVVPYVSEHKVGIAVAAVIVLTAMNLRGIRESGTAFAIPTYGFMIVIIGMILTGLFRIFLLDDDIKAPSAGLTIVAEENLTGFALFFLLLRAFSSGSAALTGVEAISNGVPAFKPPKSRNAATTLLLLGVTAITMLIGIIALARLTDLRYVEDPARQIIDPPAGYVQKTVTTQLGEAIFGSGSILLFLVAAATALILFLAANTAFNGFPVLGSILAQDRFLPRQLHTRGDRLAFSNGIVFLAAFACVLIVGFQAEVTRLIQLYIVGVFVCSPCRRPACCGTGTGCCARERDPDGPPAHAPVPRHQRVRHGADRLRARHRARHQVHPRRVDRDRRDGRHLPGDAGHPPPLRHGRPRARRRPRRSRCCRPATTPWCWSARCTSRRCGRSPTPRRPGPTR